MAEKILALVPAEPGWRAIYTGDEEGGDEARELTRIVAWALVEDEEGERSVVGMVVDAVSPTQVVPAQDGASLEAPSFHGYGYKSS